MVSPIKLVFRISHLLGALLLFASSAIVLISPPVAAHDFLKLPLGFALPGLTLDADGSRVVSSATQPIITVGRMAFWIEIVGGVLVVSGIFNAVLLAPKKNMQYVPKRLSTWRRLIYGFKFVLFALVTPMSNKLVEAMMIPRLGVVAASLDAEAQGEILRTAALVKLIAVILGVAVGSYARYYREEATLASAEVQAHTRYSKQDPSSLVQRK